MNARMVWARWRSPTRLPNSVQSSSGTRMTRFVVCDSFARLTICPG